MMIIKTDNTATHMSESKENKLAATVAPTQPELPECEKLLRPYIISCILIHNAFTVAIDKRV
jgi:hypothetical protein